MANLGFLQAIFDAVMTPLMTQLQAMIAPACAAMQPIAMAGIGIALCFWVWDFASGYRDLKHIGRQVFISMLMYSLLWTAQYTQYVTTLFLTTLPNALAAAIGAPGGTPGTQLDTVITQSVSAAASVYEALPGYSLKAAILSVGVILFVVVAVLCILFVFVTLVLASVVNILCLAVGPIFLAAATIPWTRKFASGWLSVLVGGVVTQLLGMALLELMIGAIGTLLGQMAATAAQTSSNSILMLWGLVKVAALLWLFKAVIQKVPELAQTIGGGVYHGSQAAMSMLTAGSVAAAVTVGSLAGGAAGAARGAVIGAQAGGGASGALGGAAGGAAAGAMRGASRGYRYAAPAGRSLSRRAR